MSVMLKKHIFTGLIGLLSSIAAFGTSMEISGVKVDDPINFQGAQLQLNGAGIRFKAIFKVYIAALYVETRIGTPEEFYAASGPRRLSITLLREIDSSEIGKTFAKAMDGSALKGEIARLAPELVKLEKSFTVHEKLLAGENFTIDWIPGTGTVLTVKGKPQGEPFKGAELFNALIGIWLGPGAADWKLRDALLGKAP